MTFEEFIAACPSAQVVSTTDGTALLIGTTVLQFKGMDWTYADWLAKALHMIPTEQPELEKIDA